MKVKKIVSFSIMFSLILSFIPMIAKAEEKDTEVEVADYLQAIYAVECVGGVEAFYSTPAGMCHCGAPREETLQVKVETDVCPTHSPSCTGYRIYYTRTYCYCTDPNCGDNWYTPWEFLRAEHV